MPRLVAQQRELAEFAVVGAVRIARELLVEAKNQTRLVCAAFFELTLGAFKFHGEVLKVEMHVLLLPLGVQVDQ